MNLWHAVSDWWWHRSIPASHRTKRHEARRRFGYLRALAASDEPTDRRALFGDLRRMDPLVFEELVLLCLETRGNRIRRSRRYSGDGGVDGLIFHMGVWCPIQCKRYREHIDPRHVEDLAAVMTAMGAPAAWFVHTGRTGRLARETAQEIGAIRLISGDLLCHMIAGT